MQTNNFPGKFRVPFAKNDSDKVELPVTSSDATRASLSLGFPPLTGMPPESGGTPPQREDFNGALNQVARVAWWQQVAGRWQFDSAFANSTEIGGYPAGAVLLSADGRNTWLSLADNNTVNPDTTAGVSWVPEAAYGSATISNLTGGTQTVGPLIVSKQTIILSGTLTANAVLIFPPWIYNWTIYNNTGGAFSVTVKTASGVGPPIPQNGYPTTVFCDGVNIDTRANNIAQAQTGTQAARLDQMVGRMLRQTQYTIVSGVQQVIVDGGAPTTTNAGTFTALSSTKKVMVECIGGGGAGGGTAVTNASQCAAGGGGGSGSYAASILTAGFSGVTVSVGVGGGGVVGAAGASGGNTTFGSLVSAQPGNGGGLGTAASGTRSVLGGGAGQGSGNWESAQGSPGSPGLVLNPTGDFISGIGGSSRAGGGGNPRVNVTGPGQTSISIGSGGSGAAAVPSTATTQVGGNGGPGMVMVTEYS